MGSSSISIVYSGLKMILSKGSGSISLILSSSGLIILSNGISVPTNRSNSIRSKTVIIPISRKSSPKMPDLIRSSQST